MDIQSKVAARRAELDRQAKAADAEVRRINREIEEAKAKQRADALDAIAADLSNDKVEVVRDGDVLALRNLEIPELDIAGLRQRQLKSLLGREARKLWTPGENWQVIGSFVAALCLIYMIPLAIGLLLVGWVRAAHLNKRYREVVRNRYPDIFGAVGDGSARASTDLLAA